MRGAIRKPWFRGVVTVAVMGALAVGAMLSPAGAAKKPATKKYVTKQINKALAAVNADKVDGIDLISRTVSYTAPTFDAGQQQCKDTQVTVQGVQPGDVVVMTPVTDPIWFGVDQTTIIAQSVPSANTVTVQACTSADANPPFTPVAINYRFVAFR